MTLPVTDSDRHINKRRDVTSDSDNDSLLMTLLVTDSDRHINKR